MVQILILLLLLVHASLRADEAQTEVDHVVYLSDGTVLPGRIVEETDQTLVLQHATLGRLVIARESIDRVESFADPGEAATRHWNVDPASNSILLTPTAATLPKGTKYFRSYELFLMNFGVAPSDYLNLAMGTVFPVAGDFIGLMVGGKLRVLDREKYPIGLAIAGSYTILDDLADDSLGTVGGVLGIGDARKSVNVSVGGSFFGGSSSAIFLAGADYQISARTKFVVEFGSSSALLFDEDDFDGLMNIGFRWFGERMAFTLTGFRPLGEADGLFLFPLAVFSISN